MKERLVLACGWPTPWIRISSQSGDAAQERDGCQWIYQTL